MKTRLLMLLSFSPLLLGVQGCAGLIASQDDVGQRVATLEKSGDYGEALELLSYVGNEHPDYKELMKQQQSLQEKVESYEGQVIRKADRLSRQDKWGEALNLYREARQQLPQSTKLSTAFEQFREKQARRVAELEEQQLKARAHWLNDVLPIQERITRVTPESWHEVQQLREFREEIQFTADALIESGLAALEVGEERRAREALRLAQQIAPSEKSEAALKQLAEYDREQNRRTARVRVKQQQRQEQEREQERRAELSALEAALQANQLSEAQEHLTKLEALETETPEFETLRKELQQRITAVVSEQLDQGNGLYSRGQFQAAIASWEQALELDPANEQAKANIERAERVLEKLRRLREKQSAAEADNHNA